jgi:hypothetical protein
MATTHTRSAPTSGLPYYVWEVPEKLISIQLYFDVIDRMYPDIMRGLGALRRRGAEVGGILLGRSDPDSPGTVIVVNFEPVPSEYLTGPSYNLSDNDRVGFEAAIGRHSGGEGGLSVVGFYRSHTRDELYMDDADVAVAERYFPGAGHVFLLIKPFASRTSVGGFFFWEEGRINRESSYLQFPFSRVELGGGEPRTVPASPRQEADQHQPLPPYTPVGVIKQPANLTPEDDGFSAALRSNLSILSAPPVRPPRRSRMPGMQWLLLAFLVVAGCAGFFAYRDLAAPKTPAIPPRVEMSLPLKLSVAEKQNQLDVTWDRNAAVILQARRGVLSISDGLNKRDLELSGAQLRTGRVLYSRLSADVGLRLEVFADGPNPVTESIRIVSTEAPQEPVKEVELAVKPKASPQSVAPPSTEPKRAVEPPPAAGIEKSKPAARQTAVKPVVKPPVEAVPTPSQPAPQAEAAPAEVELQRPARRR